MSKQHIAGNGITAFHLASLIGDASKRLSHKQQQLLADLLQKMPQVHSDLIPGGPL